MLSGLLDGFCVEPGIPVPGSRPASHRECLRPGDDKPALDHVIDDLFCRIRVGGSDDRHSDHHAVGELSGRVKEFLVNLLRTVKSRPPDLGVRHPSFRVLDRVAEPRVPVRLQLARFHRLHFLFPAASRDQQGEQQRAAEEGSARRISGVDCHRVRLSRIVIG